MQKSKHIIAVAILGILAAGGEAFGRGGGGGFHGGGGGGFDRGGYGGYRGYGSDGLYGGWGGYGGYGGYLGYGAYDDNFDRGYGGNFDNGGSDPVSYSNNNFQAEDHADEAKPEVFHPAATAAARGDSTSVFHDTASSGKSSHAFSLPTDAGLRSSGAAVSARGDVASGRAASEQPAGEHGTKAANATTKTAATDPVNRGSVARQAAEGTYRLSPTYYHSHALAANRWYAGRRWLTPTWVGDHPLAWFPGGSTAAAWATAGWGTANWASLGGWLGWDNAPVYFDYGYNVSYQGNNVYYGGQLQTTASDYYQQASTLAGTGVAAPQQDAQWLPLGVFAVVEGDQSKPSLTLQLAIDKQGVLRGNAIDTATEKSLAVQGAVDKTSQRVAWTIGDNTVTVYEAGLSNLTRDEAPGLIHKSADKTEQVLFARVKQDPPSESQVHTGDKE